MLTRHNMEIGPAEAHELRPDKDLAGRWQARRQGTEVKLMWPLEYQCSLSGVSHDDILT
jgi:hypothetical protein